MAQIGTEQREVIVEPMVLPVPVREQPAPEPIAVPQEAPELVPVKV